MSGLQPRQESWYSGEARFSVTDANVFFCKALGLGSGWKVVKSEMDAGGRELKLCLDFDGILATKAVRFPQEDDMKILVAGGLREDFQKGSAEEVCARALGRAIVSGGHALINGCYNIFDQLVAEAAQEAAQEHATLGAAAILTYVSPGVKPAHRLGQLRKLNVSSWDPVNLDWGIPEPLREWEALVVMVADPPPTA